MSGFRCLGQEIEHSLRVGKLADRIGLEGVHHIREFQRVADKKDFQVVPNQIPVSVLRIKFHRKPPGIAKRFGGLAAADDR
ncbi:hypothetical protein D3C74_302450 [compost metagenome]